MSSTVSFSVNFGIFPGVISVFAGLDYDGIIKQFKKEKLNGWAKAIKDDRATIDDDYLGITLFRTHKDVRYFYLILKKPFSFTDREYVTLAHEITHLLQMNLPYLLNRDEETEAEAYTHSHIMTQCLEKFRWGCKKKKK